MILFVDFTALRPHSGHREGVGAYLQGTPLNESPGPYVT